MNKQFRLKSLLENAATVMVLVTALYMLVASRRSPAAAESRYVEQWESALDEGIHIGPQDPAVVIQEFVDFQCPFCKQAAIVVDSILAAYSNVALVLYHFPLDSHPHARPAAVAVECAARQGATLAFTNAVFERQDSIGTKTWFSYARDAGMQNLEAFSFCAALPADSFPQIERNRERGIEFGIGGTPGFLVNGNVVGWGALHDRVRLELDNLDP